MHGCPVLRKRAEVTDTILRILAENSFALPNPFLAMARPVRATQVTQSRSLK